MRKYVLNEKNALVLNGHTYALVREEVVTKNSVCDQCALNVICIDYEDSRHLNALCIPEDDDQRWFFVRNDELTKFQRSELEYNISESITDI